MHLRVIVLLPMWAETARLYATKAAAQSRKTPCYCESLALIVAEGRSLLESAPPLICTHDFT